MSCTTYYVYVSCGLVETFGFIKGTGLGLLVVYVPGKFEGSRMVSSCARLQKASSYHWYS
jgi:hypothetical protein